MTTITISILPEGMAVDNMEEDDDSGLACPGVYWGRLWRHGLLSTVEICV